jgi:ubiquinol-cytochrome c reductase core subunit 2
LAINSAHGVAFHRGLGTPLHPTSSTPITKYLTNEGLHDFASTAFGKSNFAIVANGANSSEFSKWANEFFSGASRQPSQHAPQIQTTQSKYHGGEERIAHDSGNTMVIGFPGSSSFTGGAWKPESAVLGSLLGGQTNVKWSPGFSLLAKASEAYPQAHVSTTNATYSDAGLLYVTITGKASDVRAASEEAVKKIKSVANGEISSEDFKKAIATAKFNALDAGQELFSGLELTGAGLIHGGKAHQIDEVAKSIQSVSESQLKSVSSLNIYFIVHSLILYSLQRHS